MDTLQVEIKDINALAILKSLENAGLIKFPKRKTKTRILSKKLRGSIPSERADEMIKSIENDRNTWENRF